MQTTKNHIRPTLSTALLAGVWAFWWLCHPEWMSYQEQNQLFLLTTDYLWQRVSRAGGVADWLGEFIVQFFYVEWLGALVLALLYWLMHRLTWLCLRGVLRLNSYIAFALSLVPVGAFLYLSGDESMMVSLPVALTIVVGAIALMRHTRWPWWLIVVPAAAWAVAAPWTTYYRTPLGRLSLDGWERDKWELLRQDYLIRHERWDEVIVRAGKHVVPTAMWSNSVNLALAMRRELADRQFEFWQSGPDALIMPMVADNVSNLPTMEAFWRLGMVNSCLRYASDLQESILSARKSGRLERRIVECLIVNGNYAIARKHLRLLRQSLFYSSWARQAEACLGRDDLINAHPTWGRLRKLRFKDNFLYNYPELDKMLAILFQQNHQNLMALDYFLAQLLLKGDARTFIPALQWAQQYGGYHAMPKAYQDAVACIRSRQLPNTPYGRYITRRMKEGGGR